jgi:hypothetical protein
MGRHGDEARDRAVSRTVTFRRERPTGHEAGWAVVVRVDLWFQVNRLGSEHRQIELLFAGDLAKLVLSA